MFDVGFICSFLLLVRIWDLGAVFEFGVCFGKLIPHLGF